MAFVRPTKYIPANLSWEHLIKSTENSIDSTRDATNFVKLYGGKIDEKSRFGSGVVSLAAQKLSMNAVIEKIPGDATLIYSGSMVSRNHAYENQFSMLSFMAYPWLLERFRDFSDRLVDAAHDMDLQDVFGRISNEVLLQDKSGKFRPLVPVSDFVQERIKNWVKLTKEYLADPLKDDASLSFPEGFGSAHFDLSILKESEYSSHFFKLSDTRFFNLDEIKDLGEFLTPLFGGPDDVDKPSIHLISSSSIVDFLFYNRFRKLIDVEKFEEDFIGKWILGFEPFLFFLNSVNCKTNKRVIINMANLPLIEVMSFERR
ncbi:hypothetical protein N9W79_01560 [bacterium]|nr:hypothetical protein [bacterium]